MDKNPVRAASMVAAALLGCPLAQAAPLTQAEYERNELRLSADYQADRAACETFATDARDLCIEQAKAGRKVARAALAYAYSAKAADYNRLLVVRVEASYGVAKQRCYAKVGERDDACIREAKAVASRALTDARKITAIGQSARAVGYSPAANAAAISAGGLPWK